MFTKILNDNEVTKFNKLTGINAKRVFINKNRKYYYATIVEVAREVKVRISEELASNFK